ncbi:malonyl-CoA synthase [Nordella sp. HKS 07]|uniref:malonate--CoA ligase n=1 Tax=Nordella sp. HKS 07 TaxID=2712222 RepID=UPI0013E1A8D8|nr:malonyl-CoA synthase [Nordella sp. HKS 07]QIG46725.1 malonyl-CoA synthase [Nordella sp. HKS 07]
MNWSYAPDPQVRNLPELVQRRMKSPEKVFIRNGDGRTFTYFDIWALAGQMANALAAQGVKTGDRVAIQAEKSPEAITLFLACAKLGAVYLPLNTAYTIAEVDYFLGDAEPSALIVMPERLDTLADLAGRRNVSALLSLGTKGEGTFMDATRRQTCGFTDAKVEWSDLAAILYTSGTTGRSKGAMLTHGNLASNALSLIDTWRFSERDVLIHALPVYHTHGLFTATNTLLLSAGTMLFRQKFDADDVMRLMPEATTMMGVPTFYTRLLQHPGLIREATAHMRLFISGSAPLLAETHREFRERTGHAILERFGMTETNMNTSNPYDGERIAGTVGLPLPGVDVRISDPGSGTPLPAGEIGMIEVRGPNVFKGYWRMPEKTAAEFRPDGFFITGDLGRIDDNGYVSIVGRGKDLIITGGFNVYPKEVESEIDSLDGIVESAVIGLPHPDFGEGVTAVVVRSGNDLLEREILRRLEDRLAKFKLPKQVIFVDDLPRNAMGKVQKNVLRQAYADLYRQT